jgi:hypothetical protein
MVNPLRVFESSPCANSQDTAVKLNTKFIASVEEMNEHIASYHQQPQWFKDQMLHHMHCYFCFPSMLSVVAHAMQTGYPASVSNVPKNMRVIFNQNPLLLKAAVFDAHTKDMEKLLIHAGGNVRKAYNEIINTLSLTSCGNIDMIDAMIRSKFVAFDE